MASIVRNFASDIDFTIVRNFASKIDSKIVRNFASKIDCSDMTSKFHLISSLHPPTPYHLLHREDKILAFYYFYR